MSTERPKCPTTGCNEPADPTFCRTHLKPEAKRLMGELAQNQAEIAKAKQGRWQEIDVEGITAQEFLRIVREKGSPTVDRVDREVFRDSIVTKYYLKALREAGLVRTRRNKRGTKTVYIPKVGA